MLNTALDVTIPSSTAEKVEHDKMPHFDPIVEEFSVLAFALIDFDFNGFKIRIRRFIDRLSWANEIEHRLNCLSVMLPTAASRLVLPASGLFIFGNLLGIPMGVQVGGRVQAGRAVMR